MFSKNWCMNYKILIENQVFQQFFAIAYTRKYYDSISKKFIFYFFIKLIFFWYFKLFWFTNIKNKF
jgi:hypothetical protein